MRIDEIIYGVLALLLIIIILLFAAHFYILYKDNSNRKGIEVTSIAENTNCSINENVVLRETKDKGEEYIKKLYFVGDSTTYHFYKGGIDMSHILVPSSLTLTLNSNINNVEVGNTSLTISQALKEANAEIVILTLGINGANTFTENKYKTYYNKLIEDIKATSPNTKIILQSIFPVTKSFDNYNKGISNKCIDKLNMWTKEIAFEQNIKYLDTQSILKDENGSQYEHYNVQDGIHMNAEAYKAILYYIRTHAIE